MEAEELTNDILAIKNIVPTKGDIWATFEVIENEELGEWLSRQRLLFLTDWSTLRDKPLLAFAGFQIFRSHCEFHSTSMPVLTYVITTWAWHPMMFLIRIINSFINYINKYKAIGMFVAALSNNVSVYKNKQFDL